MDHVYQANVSTVSPAAPVPGSSGHVQSDPPLPSYTPTTPGPYWYWHKTESIRNVIIAAGLTPDPQNLYQLRDAIAILASYVPVPGLLDSHAEDLIFAYARRHLLSTYDGALYRVRRSNDNAQQDIVAGEDGTDTASLTAFVGSNSAYLVTWYDQSGAGLDLEQPTVSKQPQVVNAGTVYSNFHPDGNDDGMQSVGSTSSAHETATMYFAGVPYPTNRLDIVNPISGGIQGSKFALLGYAIVSGSDNNGLGPELGTANGNSYNTGITDDAYSVVFNTQGVTFYDQIKLYVGGSGIEAPFHGNTGAASSASISEGKVTAFSNIDGTSNTSESQLRAFVGYGVNHDPATVIAINAILSS